MATAGVRSPIVAVAVVGDGEDPVHPLRRLPADDLRVRAGRDRLRVGGRRTPADRPHHRSVAARVRTEAPRTGAALMRERELDVEAMLAGLRDPTPDGHRSGLVAICGRPNVGKSTLLNRLVGEKVAIVTDTPGTTRNAIRGVLTRDDAQLVFLDTPGLAKPRTLLTKRLNDLVRDTWAGVDLIVLLVDVADGIGSGDRFLARELAGVGTPIVAVANKIDRLGDKARAPARARAAVDPARGRPHVRRDRARVRGHRRQRRPPRRRPGLPPPRGSAAARQPTGPATSRSASSPPRSSASS